MRWTSERSRARRGKALAALALAESRRRPRSCCPASRWVWQAERVQATGQPPEACESLVVRPIRRSGRQVPERKRTVLDKESFERSTKPERPGVELHSATPSWPGTYEG